MPLPVTPPAAYGSPINARTAPTMGSSRSALAGFAAREAGYRRRMVTWMIWINEQYAHFGSKVISVTEREGLHTLDAIVLADDAREIHTADTHGATELVFAGFDLRGRRFIPRLDDIADVPLYGLGPGQPQLAADTLLARVRDELIVGQWDELLRLAGSIKRGWIVPTSCSLACTPTPDRTASPKPCASTGVRAHELHPRLGRRPRAPRARARAVQQGRERQRAAPLRRLRQPRRLYARDPEQLQRHMDCRRRSPTSSSTGTPATSHTPSKRSSAKATPFVTMTSGTSTPSTTSTSTRSATTASTPAAAPPKGRLRPLRPVTYTSPQHQQLTQRRLTHMVQNRQAVHVR